MKITNNTPVTPPDTPAVQRDSGRAQDKLVQREDKVELSTGTNISDPGRTARIEQLSLAVQSGYYRVSPEDVANGIIEDMFQK